MTNTPAHLSATSGASVTVTNLNMSYGATMSPAVDDVSLDIKAGEFVTLLGASGSGKTTILRIIAGFLQATGGSVHVDGEDITNTPVYRRQMGMVFQSYALFPHLSVERNVAFPLEMKKVPRADRNRLVGEALSAVHLSGFGKRKPTALSGGQQQRVALARAIVASPRVLLMDEPLGALDRRLRESLQLEILRLSRELGLTVINVTHDQEEAMSMSDRIALLADGRVAQFGTPHELYETPANTTVAEFLGESNIFTGHLASSPDGLVLDTEEGVFRVITDGPLSAGQRAAVVVRPTSIRLDSTEPDVNNAGTLSGRISDVIYTGDSVKVIVGTNSGRQLIVRRPPTERGYVVGDKIQASWDITNGHLTQPGTTPAAT